MKETPIKKVSRNTHKIFTLLSRKKNTTRISKQLNLSRVTVINHTKLLQNKGFLTENKNPTKNGKQFFTNFSYTPNNEKQKIHLHKLQIYSRIVKASKKWSFKKALIQNLPKFRHWEINNNKIQEFFLEGIRVRSTPRKIVFYFTGLKAINPVIAFENTFNILFYLRDFFKRKFNVVISQNFFITEQEIASQQDQIAEIVNAAGKKGVVVADGRFVLEIFDSRREKRAHVDLSELDELETVHARHAEDDMDGYLKHLSDAKKNHLKKQLKDWMFKNPPTLSYQYKKLQSVVLRLEAQDELIKKIEATTAKTAESLFMLSEGVRQLVEVQRK